jgi:uncharacterized membrane protein YoaK (UPF0700 family)
MDVANALHQFLVLYTWFPLTALLVFFLLIARFYQRFSEAQTHYYLYIVAIILFGALAIRQAGIEITSQDWLSALLSIAGAIFLVIPAGLLAYLMLRRKNQKE